jgi:SAM-dependent methyltransferase
MAMTKPLPGPNETPVLDLEALPFCVRMLDGPDNPAGVPNTFPFRLQLDAATGHLYQPDDPALAKLLDAAYRTGSLLGTAMDDTASGNAYASDFLRFIRANAPHSTRCLEIGVGRGFLTRRLIDAGLAVDALEPGQANAPHWQRHGVKVTADSFPSAKLPGQYDLIVAYAVLEHIAELTPFFDAVRKQLAPEGRLIIAVPDCGPCLEAGDPSILLHEHYHYFTDQSLARCLELRGFRAAKVERAGYGGVLYCCAQTKDDIATSTPADDEIGMLRAFGPRVLCQRVRIAEKLAIALAAGTEIGIYCPNRAVALLTPGATGVRFFDDDPDLHRKHYPTFAAAIENRGDLVAKPVQELWILSRSFGARIRDRLRQEAGLKQIDIKLAEHILDGAANRAGAAGA